MFFYFINLFSFLKIFFLFIASAVYSLIVPSICLAILTDIMPGHQETSISRGISRDGRTTIGYFFTPHTNEFHAFKYTLLTGIIDLGTLGGHSSSANAVSDNGSSIVGTYYIGTEPCAFKYTDFTGIVFLTSSRSESIDISGDGGVTVGNILLSPDDTYVFMHTDYGGLVILPRFGHYANATAISQNASTIIGSSVCMHRIAFKYDIATQYLTNLGNLGGPYTEATALSYDGSIIVGKSLLPDFTLRAFKYTDANGIQNLGTLGGNFSDAIAISGLGNVIIGTSALISGVNHAFKYTDTSGMEDLGTLGGNTSTAVAVSYDGSVIAGNAETTLGHMHAFIYTQQTGIIDIGTLGGNSSTVTTKGISSDGSVVTGYSETTSGTTHAFLYFWDPSAVQPLIPVQQPYAPALPSLQTTPPSVQITIKTSDAGTQTDDQIHTALTQTSTSTTSSSTQTSSSTSSSVASQTGSSAPVTTSSSTQTSSSTSSSVASQTGSSASVTTSSSTQTSSSTSSSVASQAGSSASTSSSSQTSSSTASSSSTSGTPTQTQKPSPTPTSYSTKKLVDIQNTVQALGEDSQALSGFIVNNHENMTQTLDTECTNFGPYKICLSTGGKYISTKKSDTSTTSANLTMAYKFPCPCHKMGLTIDQNLKTQNKKYKTRPLLPLIVLYITWDQIADSNVGLKTKISGGFQKGHTKITRITLPYTEEGKGKAHAQNIGYAAQLGYGFMLSNNWSLQPTMAFSYTSTTRGKYDEDNCIDFPIIYDKAKLTQSSLKWFAILNGKLTNNLTLSFTGNLKYCLHQKYKGLAGKIPYLGKFNFLTPALNKIILSASTSLTYALTQNQTLKLQLSYGQSNFKNINNLATSLNYSIGF